MKAWRQSNGQLTGGNLFGGLAVGNGGNAAAVTSPVDMLAGLDAPAATQTNATAADDLFGGLSAPGTASSIQFVVVPCSAGVLYSLFFLD